MPVLFDMHTHSSFSTDSESPVKDQVCGAVKQGLGGICLTDHMDYDFPPTDLSASGPAFSGNGIPPFVFSPSEYHAMLHQVQKQFPDLWIGTGVECGLKTSLPVAEKNSRLLSKWEWDFVIGSVHLVDEMDPYYPYFWENEPAEKRLRAYFETVWESIRVFSGFDSLGHLDYIVRYAPASYEYHPEDFMDLTDEIMKYIIRRDIALEINSSGLFSKHGTLNPHPALIKRYAELGGALITIGSDAHTPDRVGTGFTAIAECMKKTGLRQYTVYKKRKPELYPVNI